MPVDASPADLLGGIALGGGKRSPLHRCSGLLKLEMPLSAARRDEASSGSASATASNPRSPLKKRATSLSSLAFFLSSTSIRSPRLLAQWPARLHYR